jgi:hypothetical protein
MYAFPYNPDFYCLTLSEIKRLPEDTILESSDGKSHLLAGEVESTVTGISGFALSNNGELLFNYGIRDPWNHPLKDLFLIFKIIE